jgi:restriction endonuclease S subunit
MDLKQVRLDEVAEVITGVATDIKTDGAYSYYYYQPNNFVESGQVTELTLIKRDEPVQERQLLKTGDVLVKRLNPNFPLFISELPGDSIASTNLYIVRGGPNIIPEYLAFLFEQSSVLTQISQLSGVNTAIKAISAKKLMDISVPLLPIEKQVAVGKWWMLVKKQKKLLIEYIAETDKLTSALSEKII